MKMKSPVELMKPSLLYTYVTHLIQGDNTVVVLKA
jgi:hypothetical protein